MNTSISILDSFRKELGMNLLESIDLMQSILEAKSSEELQVSLGSAAKRLGFDTFVAGVQLGQPDGSIAHHVISGYPEEWQMIYAKEGYIWSDPTVAHCQTSTAPLIWTEDVFQASGAMPMFEEARSFGVSHGLSVSMHERIGTKSMISLVRDKSFEQEAHGLGVAAQALAGCTHFVLTRIAQAEKGLATTPSLTPQELETLRWASQGKTSWEISRIMSIAEPTVAFHMKNCIRKLEANNRPQALAIAIRLGLIN